MFIVVIGFLFLISCNQSQKSPTKIFIAASIFPVYDVTQNIVGDLGEVDFIVPVGANPHTYAPSPSDVQRLQNIQLFIGIDPEFDGWVEDYLPENAHILYVKPKPAGNVQINSEVHTDMEEGRGHAHNNPHIWLSVRKAKMIVQKIADVLIEIDAENELNYRKNLQTYMMQLHKLDHEIATIMVHLRMKKFIQWHPAWDYFADDYELEVLGTIEDGHGDQPSVKEFKSLIQNAKREKVGTVVMGLNVDSKTAETLVKEIDGRLVRLDSMGDPDDETRNSYIELMRMNGRLLGEALYH
jgi:zinc transport system substrate-binding protein